MTLSGCDAMTNYILFHCFNKSIPFLCSVDRMFLPDWYGSAILAAENVGSSFYQSTFNILPLSGLQVPADTEYDNDNEMVYWTDSDAGTINRAALNGSFQEVILSNLGSE